MRKFLVVTVLSACISFGASAEACTISPIDQGLFQNDHNRILEESDIIVLAVVTGFRSVGSPPRDDEGIFEFAIIETVKGTLQGAIEGFGVREDENFSGNPYSRYRFSDRNDRMFWETGIGRTTLNNTMCQLQPTFREGARYLLILGGPQDSKNYELIASEDDKWLDYVRRYFEIAKQSPGGLPGPGHPASNAEQFLYTPSGTDNCEARRATACRFGGHADGRPWYIDSNDHKDHECPSISFATGSRNSMPFITKAIKIR